MSGYSEVAVRAAKDALAKKSPAKAWDKAAKKVFPNSIHSQQKRCPRCAFLGLAEEGHIKGIRAGNYTRSLKSKGYAIEFLKLIRKNPAGVADRWRSLWDNVVGTRQEKGEMHVVIALYEGNYLR